MSSAAMTTPTPGRALWRTVAIMVATMVVTLVGAYIVVLKLFEHHFGGRKVHV